MLMLQDFALATASKSNRVFALLGLDLDLPLERGLAFLWFIRIRLTNSLRNKTLMTSGSPAIHCHAKSESA